jgi:hypothetical protein
MMSSTRFEPEDSSSGRQSNVQVRYSMLNMLEYQSVRHMSFYKYIDMNIKYSS